LNNQLQSRKRWIGLFSSPKGTIVVDAGAAEALTAKGKSLLPSGMIRAEGRFKAGDTVEIANSAGTVLAKGLTNYSNTECSLIAGMHSSCIATVLKNAVSYEVVVHRDNLYIER
jgi:glutamate 5-kinase